MHTYTALSDLYRWQLLPRPAEASNSCRQSRAVSAKWRAASFTIEVMRCPSVVQQSNQVSNCSVGPLTVSEPTLPPHCLQHNYRNAVWLSAAIVSEAQSKCCSCCWQLRLQLQHLTCRQI